MSDPKPKQLEMIWPEDRPAPAAPPLPPEFELRLLRDGEEEAHAELMRSAGFDWTADRLAEWRQRQLPDGHFVIQHRPDGRLAATAAAYHRPTERHPYGAEIGWVAVAPEFRGRRLGEAVCAAAVARCRAAGYRRIYLKTDDFRLSALRLYLRMGFQPLETDADMAARWRAIREAGR